MSIEEMLAPSNECRLLPPTGHTADKVPTHEQSECDRRLDVAMGPREPSGDNLDGEPTGRSRKYSPEVLGGSYEEAGPPEEAIHRQS